jgi:restriction endonuclease S subunit
MKRNRQPLGSLCTLVKGTSPISRTPPGSYPLVTSGEEHRTASAYQFDGEAVCVPLISSTGHGHASLKRVHYQAGRFALANLLVAVLVKDPSTLSARFLARYLMFTKDRLIVPLMTGAANMTISLDRLATVPVEFPSLEEQNRIVSLLDEADTLRTLSAQADARTADLIPALFYEMFGDPATNSKGWPVSRLSELCEIVTGNTPPRKNPELYGNFIEWVKTDDIDSVRGIVHQSVECLSEEGAKCGRPVPAGAVLVTCIAGSLNRIGDAAILDRNVAINQQINALIPHKQVESVFLWQSIKALSKVIQSRATGVMTRIINKSTLENTSTIHPPTVLQRKFADHVGEVSELSAQQAESRVRLNALFEAMLNNAFRGQL